MSRIVCVATTAYHHWGGPTVQDNIDKAARMIDWAALDRPDIVCLPETFGCVGFSYETATDAAEPVPGPTTEMAMAKVQEHNTNVICPLVEARGDVVYNSAVVVNRQGKIAGVYEKVHPVTTTFDFTEFEFGVTPGDAPKVFDLDFGRIGIAICFDTQWPCDWAKLAELGAEIVFWPSAYDGGFALQAHAWNNHYYVASAVQSSHASIIDMTGEVLACTERPQAVLTADVNLERGFFHTDFNGTQIPAIKEKYGTDVSIRRYHREGGMTVASNRSGLTVAQLMEEFDLEPVPAYIARHDRAHPVVRAGAKPEPQPPRRTKSQWSGDF